MSDREPPEAGGSPPLSAPPGPESTTPSHVGQSTQEQFAAFYRRFTAKLVGFLMWQGAPARLAADLVQETMIKAWQGWSAIEFPEAWARRVASRELVRYFSRVEEDLTGRIPEEANPLLPRPDELAEWENRHELVELLGTLPPRQRQVLAWSVSGHAPAEIAVELGIDPAAVRANLMKARRTVAERMRGRVEDS